MKELEIHTCVVGPVMTNCYLGVNTRTRELLIVDPGDEQERLVRAIGNLDAVPVTILLTHGHFDHILAAEALSALYGIPVYACEAEQELLFDASLNMSDRYGAGTVIRPDFLLQDEQVFQAAGFEVRCLHTPGHTPGGCCYYLPGEDVLFSGDTLFRGSVGRTDFPGGSMREITESLHRLIRVLPPQTEVFPGHDSPTSIGIEARYNPFV